MISVQRLRWDDWNAAPIARHDATPTEVEQVCHGDALVQQGRQGRIVLLGPTVAGRILEVVLEPEGRAVYYPVTAFLPAN